MTVLIRRIRSGEVDLKPGDKDGWYQYQVYALETMLLPSRGQECGKLLLTASYKKRLVEAFKALITKRIETHARQYGVAKAGAAARPSPLRERQVMPRLRIEPCPTFFLRTARAYAFVQNLLLATAGKDRLAKLRGLKEGGRREPNLADELESLRQRFYGMYLVSCEDIGMKPEFLKDEPIDPTVAKKAALDWLKNLDKNPDLAVDTRVCVPIYVDSLRGRARLWATLGVRLALLNAAYARPPKVRPKIGGVWEDVKDYQLAPASYVIPVDEFAEFESRGTLTRTEFRALCDRYKTKAEFLKAISVRD
jgi:hypothetical protein